MARVTNDIVFNETNRNRILDWVIDVTGSSRIQEPLEDYFKDGVLLCQYVFSYLCFVTNGIIDLLVKLLIGR